MPINVHQRQKFSRFHRKFGLSGLVLRFRGRPRLSPYPLFFSLPSSHRNPRGKNERLGTPVYSVSGPYKTGFRLYCEMTRLRPWKYEMLPNMLLNARRPISMYAGAYCFSSSPNIASKRRAHSARFLANSSAYRSPVSRGLFASPSLLESEIL